jgi:phosphinothricin acetyltransferase
MFLPEHREKVLGLHFFKHLLRMPKKKQYWTIQAHIFQKNRPSLALHQKCNFRIVGYREKLCEYQGVWHDVMLLERRSKINAIFSKG